MKITKGQTYQLIELPGGIALTYRDRRVPSLEAEPLIEGDAHDTAAYLVRYLLARESGLNLADAHKAALADAVVLRPGVQEGKVTS